jgi:hypothetical protein
MAAPIYQVGAGADVTLAAATVKSVLGIRAGAAFGIQLKAWGVSFDGVTAAAEPVLVELCYATFATNPPATNSTTETPVQASGRVLTHGMTAASNWTSEPTVLTVLDELRVHPQTGYKELVPLGDEPDTALNQGFVLRCTAAAGVDVRPMLRVSRI